MPVEKKSRTIAELAQYLGAEYQGDPNCVVFSIAPLQKAQLGQLSFLSNPLYRKYLPTTKASAVVVTAADSAHCQNSIIVEDPYVAYAKLAHLFDAAPIPQAGIHPMAIMGIGCNIDSSVSIAAHCVIGDYVTLGPQVIIGPNCSIGDHAQIGAHTRLHAHVSIYHKVIIGEHCIVHSGAVIGGDGFGMANEKGVWQKIPQLGSVMVGNHVEIGANTAIDRGALDDTVIENGVKLDNLIQIGHNVFIGENTAIAGCVAIAGSARIGRNCAIGGGSCIAGHLSIADGVTVTGMSGVYTSIEKPGIYSSGTSVQESRQWFKNVIRLRQLDELARKLFSLEKKVKTDESGV